MTKLTDTQLVLLSAASQHVDGVIPISERLKGGVAKAVGVKLIAIGLAEERRAAPPRTGWRENAEGQRLDLVITPLGLSAIGVEEGDGVREPADASAATAPPAQGAVIAPTAASVLNCCSEPPATGVGRPGTKKELVIGLLRRAEGASIDDLIGLTGWQAHTTRAALTGLRKAGMPITVVRNAGVATRYHLTCSDAGTADGVDGMAALADLGAGA